MTSVLCAAALLTHGLTPPVDGGLIKYGHWTVAALLNSPYEGSTEMSWLRGASDANVLRHLRFRVFPEAEYSMWIDGKHQLAVDPVMFFDDVLNKPGKHTAVFHHENQRCVGSIGHSVGSAVPAGVLRHLFVLFHDFYFCIWRVGEFVPNKRIISVGTWAVPTKQDAQRIEGLEWLCRCVYVEHTIVKSLGWSEQIPGYRDKIDEVGARYHTEGLPSEEDGEPQNAYDLAIIINRHTLPSNILVRPLCGGCLC